MTQTVLRTFSGQPWSEHHIAMIALRIEGTIRAEDDKLILPGAYTEVDIRRLVPGFPRFTLSLLRVR
jgi:hypothetical protein